MIIKQTEDTAAGKSIAQHVRDLYAYIHALDNPDNGHKLVFSGTINMTSTRPTDVMDEMTLLATKAKRSKNPLQHWILSIAAGETMTHDIATDMIAILARHLGYEGCQAFYGGHGNTVNDHVHVVFNRVDPVTGRCRKPEFSRIRAQKAMAEICAKFDFSRVDHALFIMDDDGELHRVVNLDAQVKIPDGARAMELHSGEKSTYRIAAEKVVPLLSSAKTWRELHEKLGELGWEYRRKGGGAVLACNGNEVKPSSLGKAYALKQMAKKLGPFIERSDDIVIVEKRPEPMPGVPEELLNTYKEETETKTTQVLKTEYENKKVAVEEWKRIETEAVKSADWKGNGVMRNAFLVALREEAADRLRTVREEYEKKMLIMPKVERFDAWLMRERPSMAESVIGAIKMAPRNVPLDIGEPDQKTAKAFRAYVDAVNADAYELSSGDAFLLDGGARLVAPDRLIALLPRIMEIGDVSISPVSANRTHIVTEMPPEAVARLRDEGLGPSFAMQRGDACQCVYTVAAKGAEKEISEALQRCKGISIIGAHGLPMGAFETGGNSERLHSHGVACRNAAQLARGMDAYRALRVRAMRAGATDVDSEVAAWLLATGHSPEGIARIFAAARRPVPDMGTIEKRNAAIWQTEIAAMSWTYRDMYVETNTDEETLQLGG